MGPNTPEGMRLATLVGKKRWATILVGVALASPVIGSTAIGLEALVRARLNDDMFAAPTRFYARRIVLYSGL